MSVKHPRWWGSQWEGRQGIAVRRRRGRRRCEEPYSLRPSVVAECKCEAKEGGVSDSGSAVRPGEITKCWLRRSGPPLLESLVLALALVGVGGNPRERCLRKEIGKRERERVGVVRSSVLLLQAATPVLLRLCVVQSRQRLRLPFPLPLSPPVPHQRDRGGELRVAAVRWANAHTRASAIGDRPGLGLRSHLTVDRDRATRTKAAEWRCEKAEGIRIRRGILSVRLPNVQYDVRSSSFGLSSSSACALGERHWKSSSESRHAPTSMASRYRWARVPALCHLPSRPPEFVKTAASKENKDEHAFSIEAGSAKLLERNSQVYALACLSDGTFVHHLRQLLLRCERAHGWQLVIRLNDMLDGWLQRAVCRRTPKP